MDRKAKKQARQARQAFGLRQLWEGAGMTGRGGLWERVGDITEEIEFEMHEH